MGIKSKVLQIKIEKSGLAIVPDCKQETLIRSDSVSSFCQKMSHVLYPT